jgi:hypothetical protein
VCVYRDRKKVRSLDLVPVGQRCDPPGAASWHTRGRGRSLRNTGRSIILVQSIRLNSLFYEYVSDLCYTKTPVVQMTKEPLKV